MRRGKTDIAAGSRDGCRGNVNYMGGSFQKVPT